MVSIIIVTYNASETLEVAIKSVIKQTYQNIECVIVDGLSTDNTVEIIRKYAALDNRIKYISEKDSGIYDAMNKGWKMASGEWILYLGGDDELELKGVEYLMKNSQDADVIYGNTTLLFPSGNRKKQYSGDYSYVKKKSFACHQSLILNKKVFKELNGFNSDYKIIADYDLLLRTYLNNYKFKKVDSFISIFYAGGASSNHLKVTLERYKIHKENQIKNSNFYFVVALLKSILLSIKQRFEK